MHQEEDWGQVYPQIKLHKQAEKFFSVAHINLSDALSVAVSGVPSDSVDPIQLIGSEGTPIFEVEYSWKLDREGLGLDYFEIKMQDLTNLEGFASPVLGYNLSNGKLVYTYPESMENYEDINHDSEALTLALFEQWNAPGGIAEQYGRAEFEPLLGEPDIPLVDISPVADVLDVPVNEAVDVDVTVTHSIADMSDDELSEFSEQEEQKQEALAQLERQVEVTVGASGPIRAARGGRTRIASGSFPRGRTSNASRSPASGSGGISSGTGGGNGDRFPVEDPTVRSYADQLASVGLNPLDYPVGYTPPEPTQAQLNRLLSGAQEPRNVGKIPNWRYAVQPDGAIAMYSQETNSHYLIQVDGGTFKVDGTVQQFEGNPVDRDAFGNRSESGKSVDTFEVVLDEAFTEIFEDGMAKMEAGQKVSYYVYPNKPTKALGENPLTPEQDAQVKEAQSQAVLTVRTVFELNDNLPFENLMSGTLLASAVAQSLPLGERHPDDSNLNQSLGEKGIRMFLSRNGIDESMQNEMIDWELQEDYRRIGIDPALSDSDKFNQQLSVVSRLADKISSVYGDRQLSQGSSAQQPAQAQVESTEGDLDSRQEQLDNEAAAKARLVEDNADQLVANREKLNAFIAVHDRSSAGKNAVNPDVADTPNGLTTSLLGNKDIPVTFVGGFDSKQTAEAYQVEHPELFSEPEMFTAVVDEKVASGLVAANPEARSKVSPSQFMEVELDHDSREPSDQADLYVAVHRHIEGTARVSSDNLDQAMFAYLDNPFPVAFVGPLSAAQASDLAFEQLSALDYAAVIVGPDTLQLAVNKDPLNRDVYSTFDEYHRQHEQIEWENGDRIPGRDYFVSIQDLAGETTFVGPMPSGNAAVNYMGRVEDSGTSSLIDLAQRQFVEFMASENPDRYRILTPTPEEIQRGIIPLMQPDETFMEPDEQSDEFNPISELAEEFDLTVEELVQLSQDMGITLDGDFDPPDVQEALEDSLVELRVLLDDSRVMANEDVYGEGEPVISETESSEVESKPLAIAPRSKQKGAAAQQVAKLLKDAGLTEAVLSGDDFHLSDGTPDPNGGVLPLTIERHPYFHDQISPNGEFDALYCTLYRSGYQGEIEMDNLRFARNIA